MRKITTLKLLTIMITILTVLTLGTNKTNATTSLQDALQGADDFVQHGEWANAEVIPESSLENMSDMLFGALLVIAVIIAAIVGLVIGIKYMTGSISEKANIKEMLIPYIAGCIVIFGAFGIWRLVVNILRQI